MDVNNNRNTIGERIARARRAADLTQADVAEKLGVSFQAVSLWERDETVPDTWNLIELAKVLKVSVSSLVENRGDYTFITHKKIYETDHMESFIRHTSRAKAYYDSLRALDFAKEAHKDQYRKNAPEIPYVYHPFNMACHCFAMGIDDDAIISACLLHDVIEDTNHTLEDLPVGDETKELVSLMTHEKDDDNREKILKKYYKNLKTNPKAALIKCVDRCNNLTTMSWGLTRKRIYRMIEETETYVLPLLKVVKASPEYNNAAWLLQYQMESTLDIYKRLM